MRISSAAVLTAFTLVMTSGCATTDRTPDVEAATIVLAASSTVPAIEAAAAAVGLPVVVSGAGSQVLVAQVRAGAPADVVLLADFDLAVQITDHGLSAPVSLLQTGVSVIARSALADLDPRTALDRPDLFVVLADRGVPLGEATHEALAAIGVEVDDDRVVSLEDSATSVLAKVESGEADLAIVYTSNAVTAERRGTVNHLGRIAQDEVQVTTWLQWTPNGKALADALRSPTATAVFLREGFTVPSP